MVDVYESTEIDRSLVLSHLSDEFRAVVDRIQSELDGLPLNAVAPEAMDSVDLAEQTVDNTAIALREGFGNRLAWHDALSDYECAWMEVKSALGTATNGSSEWMCGGVAFRKSACRRPLLHSGGEGK